MRRAQGLGIFLVSLAVLGWSEPSEEQMIRVAVARVRRWPESYSEVLGMGRARLRRMTGLSSLEQARASQRLAEALDQARRKPLDSKTPLDKDTLVYLDRAWTSYRLTVQDGVSRNKNLQGVGLESQRYWEAVKNLSAAQEKVVEDLMGLLPPGGKGLKNAFLEDRLALLTALEESKPGRPEGCVTLLEFGAREGEVDPKPFYQSRGTLPQSSPLASGSGTLLPGCRTVTQRESQGDHVLRATKGQGVIGVGQQTVPLDYGYRSIPPDTPYYFFNPGKAPLDIDFVVLPPLPSR